MAAQSRELDPAQNAEPEALVPNNYPSVPGEFQYYINTHPKELDHYLQLAALGAVLGSPKDSVERALKTSMTRRRALGVMAGAALAAAGFASSHQESALADGGEPEPTPRPETRDSYVQLIDTTTLSIDPELPDETDRKTVIVGVSTNPFANEFAELDPNNVYDRLDRVFVELCRSIQHRRNEIRDIPDRLLSDEEFTNSPMNQRALKGEVPSQLSLEEFNKKMEDNEAKDDDKKMKISLWAFDPDSDDPDKNRLMRFDPRKGMEVRILKEKPKVGFNQDSKGRWVAGYTHEIVDDKLHIGLYRQDFKPTSGGGNPDRGIYTPSYNVDVIYSNMLRLVVEDLILYGGNKQMHDGIDVKYLQKTNDLPSASLFPEVAELSLGALRTYDEFGYTAYDSAPVLHIQSSSVDASNRYRQ